MVIGNKAIVSATSSVSTTYKESDHARERRRQRGIDKQDLLTAKRKGNMRFGHNRPNGDRTAIYEYKDLVYVTNHRTGEAVTCYAKPIILKPIPISFAAKGKHEQQTKALQFSRSRWKSHTVLVVDTSGSMKEHDVWGTKSRLDAVWLCVALDFVAHRLEACNAGMYDVVSILSMGTQCNIIIREEPTTVVLYNKLVNIYNNKTVPESGHGNYIPALETAVSLLSSNKNAACAMSLMFLSDGKPSDFNGTKGYCREDKNEKIASAVEMLSKKFGRRLSFTAVGFGDLDNFDTLMAMKETAADFGVQASFMSPSMDTLALGDVITSVSTTLTSTQTEMTDVHTDKQYQVKDVERESRREANKDVWMVSNQDFFIYPAHKVERYEYKEKHHEDGRRYYSYVKVPLQHKETQCVAMCKAAFGEGAERFAFRFYELSSDMTTVVGKPHVAKESRLLLEGGREYERKKYVRTFCLTQQLARRIAKEFNKKLCSLYRVHKSTPRVMFLNCSVYELDDKFLGKQSVLVEEKLDHTKWKKYNSNNGYVIGMESSPNYSEEVIMQSMEKINAFGMGAITECDEDEDDDDDDKYDDDVGRYFRQKPPVCFTPEEVAQAFSHFSYWATGKKRLICDLQGVYCEKENMLKLSDPVIHYYDSNDSTRKGVHGRTDRGWKGFTDFFASHNDGRCGHLCRLVIRGFKMHRHNQQR